MWVYILRCRDDSLYTGIAKDIVKRIDKHNKGKGAKYTRSRLPVRLIAQRWMKNKSNALRLEAFIKKQNPQEKVSKMFEWNDEIYKEVPEDETHSGIETPER